MAKLITTKSLLEQELKKRSISQKEMAGLLGITDAYLSEILNGKKSGKNKLFDFSERLGIDIYGRIDLPTQRSKPIPVISWIHAGAFSECSDVWPVGVSGEGESVYSYVPTGSNAFALRVEGDSMMPRFMPGDIIIVDPAVQCDNGAASVVWINGEISLKLFWEHPDEIILKPMNEKYPETIIRKESQVDFRVIGKVVDIKPKL